MCELVRIEKWNQSKIYSAFEIDALVYKNHKHCAWKFSELQLHSVRKYGYNYKQFQEQDRIKIS